MTAGSRPGRGVRLGDLNRSQVYRIGYVGRRWEVVGIDDCAPDADSGPVVGGAGGTPASEARRPPAPYTPRHVAPAAQPD